VRAVAVILMTMYRRGAFLAATNPCCYVLSLLGRSHNYTIVWHTGSNTTMGRTDFYIDGVYLGTNNVFSPTRGSRLYVAHWGPDSKNPLWNGAPNDWGGGTAGDGKIYNMTSYVSNVRTVGGVRVLGEVYSVGVTSPCVCVCACCGRSTCTPSTKTTTSCTPT